MSSPGRVSPSAPRVEPWVGSAGIPVLDALPEGPRARLVVAIARLDLEAGITVLREGETTDFLAIVVAGRVAVHMRVPERGPITILTLEPGDIVGWSAIVAPYRATTSVTTLEPTELAMIDAETLRGLLATDLELAAALHPLILDTVVSRLVATRVQLLDLFHGREAEPW